MAEISIRNVKPADFARILELNQTAVRHTSSMDLARLAKLDHLADYHKLALIDGQIAGFLMGMCYGTPYINANFQWFSDRLKDFVYIDRVVVDAAFAGHGVGSALYQDLANFARRIDITSLVCEINVEPPNPASMAFHQKWHFKEIGSEARDDGQRRIAMMVAELDRKELARQKDNLPTSVDGDAETGTPSTGSRSTGSRST